MRFSLFSSGSTNCPYCYKNIKLDAVAFRCAGRGEPGYPQCKKVIDPVRQQQFNDSTVYLPVLSQTGRNDAYCSSCGGRTGIRICPSCHSVLPHNLDANSPLFGLVGVRNSGKTVLLTVLHKELIKNVARRFNAAIDNPGGTVGLAQELQKFEQEMMREEGFLPAQTPVGAGKHQAPAVYEWRYDRKGKAVSTIFSFYDNAGEDVSNRDAAINQEYLSVTSGIILLLDPFSFPENLAKANKSGVKTNHVDSPESVLDAITYVLQTAGFIKKNKKIKIPLAVVITKIDAFFDQIPESHPLRCITNNQPDFDMEEADTIHDYVASLIVRWGGDNLLRKLEQNFENYKLFGVSALGAEPNYSSGKVNSHGVLPHRVAEPLLWLMAFRKFIPIRKK